MATKPFTVTIEGKKITVYQNAYTGLFHTIWNNGRHGPVDYNLIETQLTDVQRLKYWRNRCGYTQTELAERVHVSSKTVIMMWEKGLRHPTSKYRRLINAELGHDIFLD
jgi:DNA-binding XRE family transcriptional regulator